MRFTLYKMDWVYIIPQGERKKMRRTRTKTRDNKMEMIQQSSIFENFSFLGNVKSNTFSFDVHKMLRYTHTHPQHSFPQNFRTWAEFFGRKDLRPLLSDTNCLGIFSKFMSNYVVMGEKIRNQKNPFVLCRYCSMIEAQFRAVIFEFSLRWNQIPSWISKVKYFPYFDFTNHAVIWSFFLSLWLIHFGLQNLFPFRLVLCLNIMYLFGWFAVQPKFNHTYTSKVTSISDYVALFVPPQKPIEQSILQMIIMRRISWKCAQRMMIAFD